MDEPKDVAEAPELEPEVDPEPEAPVEPEVEPEAEPELEPEAPVEPEAEVRLESHMIEALEKESTRHEKALVKILGAGATDHVCEACEGMGYMPPGMAASEAPPEHDDYHACPVCAGWGVVQTGSMREGHVVRDCPDCNGRGYVERLPNMPRVDGNVHELEPAEPAPEFGVPAWMGDPKLTAAS